MNRSLTLLFLSISILAGCKKEKALTVDEQFEGRWYHYELYESGIRFKELQIQSDSKGEIWYSDGWNVYGDTQTRKWLVKNDNLYFGWTATGSEKFKIDAYPAVAGSLIISGIDTVAIGEKYMILDGNYFCTQ